MNEAKQSPRTDEEPFAFTRDELWSGAGWTWVAFTALLLVITGAAMLWSTLAEPATPGWGPRAGLLLVVQFWVLVIGGSVSFAVIIVALPLAMLVARGMRRIRSVRVHLTVFAALGASVGVLVLGVGASGNVDPAGFFWNPILLPATLSITTTSVAFGWLRASRQARRELRTDEPRSPLGLERAFDGARSPY